MTGNWRLWTITSLAMVFAAGCANDKGTGEECRIVVEQRKKQAAAHRKARCDDARRLHAVRFRARCTGAVPNTTGRPAVVLTGEITEVGTSEALTP